MQRNDFADQTSVRCEQQGQVQIKREWKQNEPRIRVVYVEFSKYVHLKNV